MGAFFSKLEHQTKKKLPIRGRKRLLFRGPRKRRLQLLKEFEVGRIYTFCPISELEDLPDETLLGADDDLRREVTV